MEQTNDNLADLELARRAAAGEGEAWRELIDRYGERLHAVAHRFARSAAEAEDLTQDVFLKLYRNLHLYNGQAPLMAWALRLSRNLCIEHYRRTRAERRALHLPIDDLTELAGGDDPQAASAHRQQLQLVQRALAEMSRELALAVELRDLQGLAYEEVAAFLDVPMGTVKSRLVRGRQEVAERIARLLGDAGRAQSLGTTFAEAR